MRLDKLLVGLSRRGAFTLIELMIVVVIVAILAMVAIPLYQSSVENARMSEGISKALPIVKTTERETLFLQFAVR